MVMQTADQTLVQQRMENQPTLMEIVPQSSNPSVSIHQQQVSAATNIHCESLLNLPQNLNYSGSRLGSEIRNGKLLWKQVGF